MADSVPASSTGGSRSFIDPLALMRIKNLQLRAKAVVEGFFNGLHRSPYHGFSVEFSEYRSYTPSDDPRHLDWRLYGRSDRFYIKRFEEETNRRCYLLVDLSRSMGYSSIGYPKAEYARTLAATLAYFFTQQRDSVGLMIFDQAIVDMHPARYRTGHMGRLMASLERAAQGTGTDLNSPLEQVARTVKKRGLVILISDLLASTELLEANLRYLRSRGHEVLLLRTLDPAEVDFPFESPVLFRDMETNRDLYVTPADAKRSYQEQFQSHDGQIKATCDRLGITYSRMMTNQPLENALFDLLQTQLHRGRSVTHRVSPRGGASSGASRGAGGSAR